jgi:hypothetical protein
MLIVLEVLCGSANVSIGGNAMNIELNHQTRVLINEYARATNQTIEAAVTEAITEFMEPHGHGGCLLDYLDSKRETGKNRTAQVIQMPVLSRF